MSRVLVLAGGSPHAHDFAATGAELVGIAEHLGHTAVLVDHPDVAAARLSEGFDGLVVDGLWWRMHGDAYDRWRSEFGYSAPAATREALADHVRDGGGLLAVHTASICFDDWPGWADVVGGGWRWGTSWHPPVGQVSASVRHGHQVTEGLPEALDVVDEVYGDLDIRPDVEVLVTARRGIDDPEQPVVWTHRFGSGRVVYDGFGHDVDSLRDPLHRRLIESALAWTLEDG